MAGSHRSMQPEHVAPHWPSAGAEKDEDGRLFSCLARGMYKALPIRISEQGNHIFVFQSHVYPSMAYTCFSSTLKLLYKYWCSKYTTTY